MSRPSTMARACWRMGCRYGNGRLERLGIVKELTAQKRNRLFGYAGYVEIMSRGTELPGR